MYRSRNWKENWKEIGKIVDSDYSRPGSGPVLQLTQRGLQHPGGVLAAAEGDPTCPPSGRRTSRLAGPRVSHGIGKALKRREVFPQRSHITVADHLPISALRQNSIDKKYIQTSISDRNLHRLAKSVRRRLQEVMLACSKLSEVITLDRLGSGQQQQHLFLMPPVRIPVPAHESPGICFPVAPRRSEFGSYSPGPIWSRCLDSHLWSDR